MTIAVADQMTIQMQLINVIIQTTLELPSNSSWTNRARHQIGNQIALYFSIINLSLSYFRKIIYKSNLTELVFIQLFKYYIYITRKQYSKKTE